MRGWFLVIVLAGLATASSVYGGVPEACCDDHSSRCSIDGQELFSMYICPETLLVTEDAILLCEAFDGTFSYQCDDNPFPCCARHTLGCTREGVSVATGSTCLEDGEAFLQACRHDGGLFSAVCTDCCPENVLRCDLPDSGSTTLSECAGPSPLDVFSSECLAAGGSLTSGCADGETDDDQDGYCTSTQGLGSSCDCDDSNADVHSGAPEINDGVDNQCPGTTGFGLVDEIGPDLYFAGSDLCWDGQPGAFIYNLIRSPEPRFVSQGCEQEYPDTTCGPSGPSPDPGQLFYYLVRAAAPTPGSWGASSAGQVRAPACPF